MKTKNRLDQMFANRYACKYLIQFYQIGVKGRQNYRLRDNSASVSITIKPIKTQIFDFLTKYVDVCVKRGQSSHKTNTMLLCC